MLALAMPDLQERLGSLPNTKKQFKINCTAISATGFTACMSPRKAPRGRRDLGGVTRGVDTLNDDGRRRVTGCKARWSTKSGVKGLVLILTGGGNDTATPANLVPRSMLVLRLGADNSTINSPVHSPVEFTQ